MKEYTKQKEIKETNKLKAIVCDNCKKKDTDPDWSSITTISIDFGFGSKYDTDRWDIDLCDDCIDEIILPLKED